jgi:hypothetical protein
MVSFDGIVEMLGANAHIVQADFPTCVNVSSCNAIVLMEVEKYLKPFAKISKKVEIGL